jgi:hypothetical protein
MAIGIRKLTPACKCGQPITWPEWHASGLCQACRAAQQQSAAKRPAQRAAAGDRAKGVA